MELLKSITPPSLEEIRNKLSAESDSQSVKEAKGGSTAGGPHINGGDLMRAFRLRR